MENLKKAKERAESYLYRIIEQKWDSFVKNEKQEPGIPVLIKERGRPPRTIRIKMKKRMDYFELMNWPLRFEAYSYLGHKYKNKINSFAIELRELWNEWIELSKKGLIGSEIIFWPDDLHFSGIYKDRFNEWIVSFPVFEIERHISMFRAKEILGIGGYDVYFNRAKKRIINMLYSNPLSFLGHNDARIIWQVVRSPFLKSEISEHLKVMALRIIDDTPLESGYSPIYQSPTFHKASSVFFLCFGFFGNEFLDLAKKDISQLIDKQEKNGSFGFDVLTTCLSASSIHFTKLDWSESVCDKAVEYILEKQNKEGYWDFLFGETISHGDRTDWNVLSTVIALETLDFIKDDKPLPLWVTRKKIVSHQEDKKPHFFTIRPFPAPEGTSWQDVHLIFKSNKVLKAIVNEVIEERDFAGWGLTDRKDGSPNVLCGLLQDFSKNKIDGKYFKGKDLKEKQQKRLIKNISRLRRLLKWIFKIYDDPFPCKDSCYEAELRITIESKPVETKSDFYSKGSIQDKEIEEVYTEDIQKKIDEREKKIEYARKEEIKGR